MRVLSVECTKPRSPAEIDIMPCRQSFLRTLCSYCLVQLLPSLVILQGKSLQGFTWSLKFRTRILVQLEPVYSQHCKGGGGSGGGGVGVVRGGGVYFKHLQLLEPTPLVMLVEHM